MEEEGDLFEVSEEGDILAIGLEEDGDLLAVGVEGDQPAVGVN